MSHTTTNRDGRMYRRKSWLVNKAKAGADDDDAEEEHADENDS
jgi:hypothetical protein